MARGCYSIQSLHSHRQTHTGTMKSFALVLGRCDITYDEAVIKRYECDEALVKQAQFRAFKSLDTVISSYQQKSNIYWQAMWLWELELEDTNTKMLFLGYIQYFLSCKINVSPSKSWTLRSKKNDCYPICWQSVCELFSQLWRDIFLASADENRTMDHTAMFSSQCHKPHHCS